MLHRTCLLIVALLGLQLSMIANANDASTPLLSEADCAAILDNNGIAPKSVPAALVDSCKNAPLVAPAAAAIAAAADPCSGDAINSVYCWGPWTGLAPAAGGGANAPAILSAQDFRPEFAERFGSDVDNPAPPPLNLPLGPCIEGASCGFASVVAGGSGNGSAADTELSTFSLAADGSSFVVAAGESNEIQSVAMTPSLAPRGGDNYVLDAVGVEVAGPDTQVSQLQARVTSADGVTIIDAADRWANANVVTGVVDAQSGYFAHGTATTLADLDQLRNLNATVNFAGRMSVDPGTTANITLNYGTASTWTGNWSGNYGFDAGGAVEGANFVSDASQFSGNVAGGYVQGAVLGPLGDQSAAIAVDVTLNGIGNIKDVGLLQQTP
jgi:hypothetical protein